MSYKFIFGPVSSRRFGSSLGIDLSPVQKSCNFDCLYCELTKAKAVRTINNEPTTKAIIDELKLALNEFKDIDVITITANGEPSLYSDLSNLITQINSLKKTQKSLILSNGSAVLNPEISKALLKLDIVKFSLDSADPKTFRKIDRSIDRIDTDNLIELMSEFRAKFKGELIMEVLVVAGYNDSDDEFIALNRAFKKILPHRVDISTIDRPPAHNASGVSIEKLYYLSTFIDSAPVAIASKTPLKSKFDYTQSELEKLLKLRPQSLYDIENNYTQNAKSNLANLINQGKITECDLGGMKFYRIL